MAGQQNKSGDNRYRIIEEARRRMEERENTYREKALKLYPWVCTRCGREFSGKRLRELTVHHKDHNHDNNPSDGSNWELLCIYCHDDVHSRYGLAEAYDNSPSQPKADKPSTTFKAFAGLGDLLKDKK